MSFLAVAAGRTGLEVLARVQVVIPSHWEICCRTTQWGGVVAAGEGVHVGARWLLLGRPTPDPRGIPDAFVSLQAFDDDFERYGDAAMLLAGGPLLAFDLERGQVVVSVNGILPFHVSVNSACGATVPAAVSLLGAGHALPVPAGHAVSPGTRTTTQVVDGPLRARAAGLTRSGIDSELSMLLQELHCTRVLSPSAFALLPSSDRRFAPHLHLAQDGSSLVFTPPLTRRHRSSIRSWAQYLDLRDRVVPHLAWRARLLGWWTYVPLLEAPAADMVWGCMNREAS